MVRPVRVNESSVIALPVPLRTVSFLTGRCLATLIATMVAFTGVSAACDARDAGHDRELANDRKVSASPSQTDSEAQMNKVQSQPSPKSDKPEEETGPFLLVRVTRLEGPFNPTVRLSADGTLERWDASYGTVFRTGSAQLTSGQTTDLFDMAGTVPGANEMGDGAMEGDIYFLIDSRLRSPSAYLEPLAPESLKQLINQLIDASESAMQENKEEHFLRAEMIDPGRAERLRAKQAASLPVRRFDAREQSLLARAGDRPNEFLPLSGESADRLRELGGDQDFFVVLEDERWIQVGLWGPP